MGAELLLISDEFSWDAVIAPDGGEVPYEEARRMLCGINDFPDDYELEEQRFREVIPVSRGADWDREFAQGHTGPIHGWKVEL